MGNPEPPIKKYQNINKNKWNVKNVMTLKMPEDKCKIFVIYRNYKFGDTVKNIEVLVCLYFFKENN